MPRPKKKNYLGQEKKASRLEKNLLGKKINGVHIPERAKFR